MQKIVCLGDSITYGYDGETKKQVSSPYPKHLANLLGPNYEVINSGNVGWQARQTVKHLDELVFNYEPDICILMLGINDSRGSRQGLMVSKKNYYKNMQKIIDEIRSRKITLILLTPTPIKFLRGKKFQQYAIDLAEKNDLLYLDLYGKIYHQLKLDDQQLEAIIADNVHLNQEYYLKLAQWVYQLLEQAKLLVK